MQFINFLKYQADRRGALTLVIQATTGCAGFYCDGSVRHEERASINKYDGVSFTLLSQANENCILARFLQKIIIRGITTQKATDVSHGLYRVADDEYANGFGHLMHSHGLSRILSAGWVHNSFRKFYEQAIILSRGLFGTFSVG